VERAVGFKLNVLRLIVIALFATLCYQFGWASGHESAISQLFLPPAATIPTPGEAELRKQAIARQSAAAAETVEVAERVATSDDCGRYECAANDNRPANAIETR
jgi:hypothetical protein